MGANGHASEAESCFVKKHVEEIHDGEERRFTAKTTHCNKDSLTTISTYINTKMCVCVFVCVF